MASAEMEGLLTVASWNTWEKRKERKKQGGGR